ncbi:MAG TPA: hypothetical protein VG961_01255, partial [Ignavibacteria bacterium]|nr:hypothetical protein [Ignavibacteria bacterium]
MKITGIFFLFVFLNLSDIYSQLQLEWERRYNNPVNGEDDAYTIDVDNAGNSYVSGRSYNGNNYDITTIKYDNSGNVIWSKNYGGSTNLDDYPVKIMADLQNNIIVAGRVSDTGGISAVLLKYSGSGSLMWSKMIGGNQGVGSSLGSFDLDYAGNIYLWNSGSEGNRAFFVMIKCSQNGDTLWTKKIVDTLNSGAHTIKIVTDSSGNSYAMGSNSRFLYLVKVNTAGGLVWLARRVNTSANDFCLSSTGEIYVTGYFYIYNGNRFNTMKFSSNGLLIWEAFYHVNSEEAFSVVTAQNGSLYVTGRSNYSGNLITVKYDSSGAQQWVRTINGYFFGMPIISSESSLNSLLVLGSKYINPARRVIVLTKYDESGAATISYDYSSGSNMEDVAYDMKLGNNNEIYITGKSMASITHFDYLTLKFSQPIGIDPVSSEIP